MWRGLLRAAAATTPTAESYQAEAWTEAAYGGGKLNVVTEAVRLAERCGRLLEARRGPLVEAR